MQQCLPIFALFLMLLSMLVTAFIATIFHEVTVCALFQFDVVNSGDPAVSTANVCFCQLLYPHPC